MNQKFSQIVNYKLYSLNGVIGDIVDLLIDDDNWNVRYFVTAMRKTISIRKVLISPIAVCSIDAERRMIATTLTSQQVMESPQADWAQPISQQYEEALVQHFGWPIYWLGRITSSPQTMESLASTSATTFVDDRKQSSLRSLNELESYELRSRGGEGNSISDFSINTSNWYVNSIAICRGKHQVPTTKVNSINWSDRIVNASASEQLDSELLPDELHVAAEPMSAGITP